MLSFKLFHYPQFIYGDEHSMTDEQVFTEMDKVAYRPATPIETLSLAVVHPLLQTYFPIIACGLAWKRSSDKRGVMFLGADGRKRKVGIHWYAFGGNNKVRFLGVRKESL